MQRPKKDTLGETSESGTGFSMLTQLQKLQVWALGLDLGLCCGMLSLPGSLVACRKEVFPSPPLWDMLHSFNPEFVLCKSCRTVKRSRKHVMCLNMLEQYADQRGLFIKIFMWGEAPLSYVSWFLERPCFQDQAAVCLLYWADSGHSGEYIMPKTSVL